MHRFLLAISLLLFSACAFGQQEYVGRYDAFGGYSYLSTGNINLKQRGFHTQVGINKNSWLSLGFDYSRFTGHSSLTPAEAPAALQLQIGTQLGQLVAAGIIPPTYVLRIPFNSTTQTFAAGPQLNYRRYKSVTLFIHPSVGAIREAAVPHPTDFVSALVVKQLAPSGTKLDWTGFYGVGGGADLNAGRHFSIRLEADYVRNHLFNDLLRESRNSLRLSVGPSIHFGRNVAK